ncbi:dihydroorotate dehydrogenase [Leuconostoc litchii]|uniref:DsbA family protein n=1 Tax=Leuconostoc litchii TaxID=1981069 RepID=A0A6P2CMV0_9LACO|nr:DsbA family protein [Leuconostoc litchii]TYC47260.1 DsbA family protein [Leuconostoc litchii]GMA69245.1 dihydroorotate dehydrogenase [Leuconostoc litchii]
MLSIYHFDTPLSDNCLLTEQYLQNISEKIERSHHLFFVPIISESMMNIIKESIVLSEPCVDKPEDKITLVYRLILDFKAAQIEGNKKARALLIELQKSLLTDKKSYSLDLVTDVAKMVNLNIQDFLYNRNSSETVQSILDDQQLAHDMLTKIQPTVAIDDAFILNTQILTNFSVDDLLPAFLPHIDNHKTQTKTVESSVNLA